MIQTAEELIKQKYHVKDYSEVALYGNNLKEIMIEFTKLHVQATLESAAKNTKEWHGNHGMLKQSILNSYPLTNIK